MLNRFYDTALAVIGAFLGWPRSFSVLFVPEAAIFDTINPGLLLVESPTEDFFFPVTFPNALFKSIPFYSTWGKSVEIPQHRQALRASSASCTRGTINPSPQVTVIFYSPSLLLAQETWDHQGGTYTEQGSATVCEPTKGTLIKHFSRVRNPHKILHGPQTLPHTISCLVVK